MHVDLATSTVDLSVPHLYGWAAWQARQVHRIKCAALRQLHASAAGERLLLRIYLAGEEATEIALQSELSATPPAWLERQAEQHLRDERRHAAVFSAALAERGAGVKAGSVEPDAFSRRKIAQWHQLAHRYQAAFSAGLIVPAYAIALCAEQMASRVLERHCTLIGEEHPLFVLLSSVLADENRHVRLCQHTLTRLVRPVEYVALMKLLNDVRRIERSWGITGTVALYLSGVTLRLWQRP